MLRQWYVAASNNRQQNAFIKYFWQHFIVMKIMMEVILAASNNKQKNAFLKYFWEHFIVMKIKTEGNFPKTKFKIKTPKINSGTLIVTLLNSLKY